MGDDVGWSQHRRLSPGTFVDFPPMQKGASFNPDNVEKQIVKAIESQAGK